MKKCISMLLCLCLATAVSPAFAREAAASPLRIVSTIFPPYDFVRNIAGDRVELTMLLPPGSESHSFEPSPRDIITIAQSDLFVYIGGETDGWVDRILESIEGSDTRILPLLGMVEARPEAVVEGMEHGHAHGEHGGAHQHDEGSEHDHDGEHDHAGEHAHDEAHDHDHDGGHDHGGEAALDEHVWTSPRMAKGIVSALAQTLCEMDPQHAAEYTANAAAYLAELDALDAEFEAVVDGAARRTVLFGDRFPFRYLADAYGLAYYAAFPGCATETEASAATVAFLIDKTKEENLPAVFTIEFSTGRIADAICEATGAKRLQMHSCHNVSAKDFAAGRGYLELMRENAGVLKEALN